MSESYCTTKFFFVIVIFLYICNPPLFFIPFSPSIAMILPGVVLLLLIPKSKLMKLHKFALLVFIVLVYAGLVDVLSKSYSTVPLSQIYSVIEIRFFFEVIVVSFVIAYYIDKNNKANSQVFFIECLRWVVVLQFIFAMIMFVSPVFKEFLFFEFMRFDATDKITSPEFFLIRGFGLANGYFFEFPVAFGLISVILFGDYFTRNSNASFVVAFMAVIIGIVNARTAVIPVLLYFLIMFAFLKLNLIRLSKGSLVISIIIFIMFSLVSTLFDNVNTDTFKWVLNGFTELSKFFVQDSSSGTFNDLSSMRILPNEIVNIILGDFSYVHYNGINSDIGYAQYIFFGGGVFLLLSLMPYAYLTMTVGINSKSNFSKYGVVFVTAILGVFIIMYKGRVILPNGYNKLLFIFYFLIVFNDLFKRKLSG